MRNFIDSIIRILVFTVVFLIILYVCFNIYTFFFLTQNNVPMADSVSYIIFPDKEENLLTSKELLNFSFVDSSINNIEDTTEIAETSNFYYSQLDNNSKLIYDALEDNISNLKKENYIINFGTKFNDLLNQANGDELLNYYFQSSLDAFFYDHPELFYIDLTKITLTIRYTTIGPKTTYAVSLAPKDDKTYLNDSFKTENEVDEAIAKVENIKDSIIDNLSGNSDYNNVLKVHDMLLDSIEYSVSKNNTHNIYGALIDGGVVCEGYAKAFKYILDSLDIECILVNGTATNSNNQTESHMWNYVKLNNNWYGVDLTWDDPIVVGGSTKNIIRHDYFCKGRKVFNKSHNVSNKISNEGMLFSLPNLSYENYK